MKRNDYIKLLSAGLLYIPEEKLQQLRSFIEQRFEVKVLRKVNAVSIGGQLPDKQYAGLIDWALALRKENIQHVQFYYGSFKENALPPHIASAFAGVDDIILNVKTDTGFYLYILQTAYSSSNEITPHQLAELVNAQYDPVSEWKRIEELIQQSNELNNRPRIAEGSAEQHLISSQGYEAFEWQVGDFVKELQLNAIINNQSFVIPEHLKHLLYQSTFSFPGSGREYTYLYPLGDINGLEITRLIQAQSFEDQVWQKIIDYAKEYPTENLPEYSLQEWKENADLITASPLNALVSVACRAICECCDDMELKPVIPESLKQKLGPDELEAKRIAARSKIENNQWFLTANSQPWEANLLELVDYKGTFTQESSEQELKKNLHNILTEIGAFAAKHESFFAQAFQLAAYCLSDEVPKGSFDEAHKNTITAELKRLSFSEQAIENFSNTFYYSQELMIMGWPTADIFAFFACHTADVFGGMGSWNDQYFEPAEEQDHYHRLSGELFDALKKYFVTLISYQ